METSKLHKESIHAFNASIQFEFPKTQKDKDLINLKFKSVFKVGNNLNADVDHKIDENKSQLFDKNTNTVGFRKTLNPISGTLPLLAFRKSRACTELAAHQNKLNQDNIENEQEDEAHQKLVEENENPLSKCSPEIKCESGKKEKLGRYLKKIESIETETPSEIYTPANSQIENLLFRPPSLLNNEYDFIDKSEIVFKLEEANDLDKYEELIGFWKTKSSYVRLIKSESNEEYTEQQQHHRGLLKIFGKMKYKFFEFFVTESFKGFKLSNILDEYGPCSERLIKRYLKMLIKGLSIVHNKGHSYNILTPSRIFSTPDGELSIDTIKGRSTARLTNEEKRKNFYYLSPELLINAENGSKNDTWSLGCVTLSMILGKEIDENISIHPYNFSEKEVTREVWKSSRIFQGNSKKLKETLDSVLKFKKEEIEKANEKESMSIVYGQRNKSIQIKSNRIKFNTRNSHARPMELEISQELDHFVWTCLKIIGRPEISELVGHPFLRD